MEMSDKVDLPIQLLKKKPVYQNDAILWNVDSI